MEKSVVKAEYTVQDCINFYEKYGYRAVINDGQLLGFVRESRKPADRRLEILWLNAAI